jgi:hypothetical protein
MSFLNGYRRIANAAPHGRADHGGAGGPIMGLR